MSDLRIRAVIRRAVVPFDEAAQYVGTCSIRIIAVMWLASWRFAVAVRVVRLGSPRLDAEGLRIGTVRRPPRGVPKAEFAHQNWYDVWFPNLAPSAETMKLGQLAANPADWAIFVKKYRAEMATPDSVHAIALLAALSHQTNFSIGCYCEDESHCHRSVLRQLFLDAGATFA